MEAGKQGGLYNQTHVQTHVTATSFKRLPEVSQRV